MIKEMNDLIDAAEERAKLYDGDDRDCIKADVMNAFFAGAAYAQAAANKAAEEGGLPDLRDWIIRNMPVGMVVGDPAWWADRIVGQADRASRQVANQDRMIGMATWISQNPSRLPDHACRDCVGDADMVISGFRCGYHDALAFLNSPDTRQVANKAEVDLIDELAQIAKVWDGCEYDDVGGAVDIGQSLRKAFNRILAKVATTPATTGASTARDQALEEAAIAIEDFEEKKRFVSFDEIANSIRALKGSVGASTVLTDLAAFAKYKGFELPVLNNHGEFHQDWLQREFAAFKAGRAIAREVAAQAGQVAVPDIERRIPDSECAQSSCARGADGCKGKCCLSNVDLSGLITSPAKESK